MDGISTLLAVLFKAGAVLFIVNEVRGFILAVPVMVGIYQAGGDWMAIWIGVCSLAGIALSVIVPLFAAKKLGRYLKPRKA